MDAMRKWMIGLLLCLLVFQSAALASGNLILNGDFEQVDASGNPEHWARDMWQNNSSVSKLYITKDGIAGSRAVEVRNVKSNDARFIQEVAVEPNTCYVIRCMVRATGCDPDKAGASISIKDTFVSTEYIYDTGGNWEPLELYGITGEDQHALTVMARLGDYGSLGAGTAWFDNFEMEQVENAVLDQDVDVANFQTLPPTTGDEAGFADGVKSWVASWTEGSEQVAMILVIGGLFAVLCAMLVWSVGRGSVDLNHANDPKDHAMWWILAIAFVIRLILSFTVRGYGVDMTCFEAWSQRVAELGPPSFYAPDYFCDYPPGYLYVLGLLGWIRALLHVPFDSNLDWMIIKLPPMILDLVAAMFVYKYAKRNIGRTAALMLGGMYAFNPAAILNSAAWGQIDAALAILILLSIQWAIEDKWQWALPAFAVAILVKPQALMFAPLGLLALVMEIVRSKDQAKALRKALQYIGIALGVAVLLCIPFVCALNPGLFENAQNVPGFLRPIWFIFNLYGKTLSSYPYITLNACNLYTLLDKNWADLSSVMGMSIIAWAMMGLSYVYAGYLYVKAKSIRKLPLIAAMLLSMVFCLGAKMHERYLFPALVLLLVAYIEDMDIRILIAFITITFTQFVNAALVLRSEHLQAAEQMINAGVSLLNLMSASLLGWASWDLCVQGHSFGITRVYYHAGSQVSARRQAQMDQFAETIFKPRDHRLGMKIRDYALLLLLTGVYAIVAFTNLGVQKAPETIWTSSAAGEQITVDLGEIRDFHLSYYMTYFIGDQDDTFKVQISEDGEAWSKEYYAEYDEQQIFRWIWYQPYTRNDDGNLVAVDKSYIPKHDLLHARYVRLTMVSDTVSLNEIGLVDGEGNLLPIVALHSSGGNAALKESTSLLIDEQDTVPGYPSYLNSSYFDEIYHARTAYENIHGLHTYEYTHPPLGKLLIALGINMFGMNPFGWRFMGTLFGVLMIPLMYLLAKLLMKRTSLAFISTFLLAVDCMHFTQTRIATIDSFAVFFIMLMYLFMLKYTQMSFFHVKLWRTLIPLALCGVTMGCAIASKWIGIYASIGLAVLFFFSMWVRFREYRYVRRNMEEIDAARRKTALRINKLFGRNLAVTLVWCVVFFVAVPLLIYYFSYYWQLVPDGTFNVKGVWTTQQNMLRYHAGLGADDHLFRSPWYQWPVIAWPMWYYTGTEYLKNDYISSISCMGNPVVFWGGLVAMVFVLCRTCGKARHDRRYLFLTIGFLSQYLPWVLVPRSTFIYHYFASVPFIIMATALMLDWVRKRKPMVFKVVAIGYCVAALGMFAFFYPIISGTPIPRWYAQKMSWFNWINFN